MSGLSSYLLSTLSRVGGIGGSGLPDFHFTIGEKVQDFAGKTIWELHHAYKNDDKQEAAVFVFDKTRGSSYTAVAQNALKRMRTLRHPGVLKYLEGTETPEAIYIATEPVTPLVLQLSSECEDELKRWGLHKLADTLSFINEDCKLVHANLSTSSVFVTKAGEWKLGGLELVDSPAGSEQVYRHYTSAIPGYSMRMAPEFESQGWDRIEKGKAGSVDGWSLACLIYQVYNGDLTSTSQLQTQGQIPKGLWAAYQRLLVSDLRNRMTPGEFLQHSSRSGGFFDSAFVKTSIFLENIAVKEEDEKAEFFSNLDTAIEGFPQTFSKFKILPELLRLMEYGGGDAKVLGGIIHIGKALDETEYNELVTPAIVKLFSSNDRALRFTLLERIGSFIDAIPTAVVTKKVFPDFATGFLDAAPAIREATVKASLAVAPKLSQKVLNNDLIKQLVRLVGDAEPGIRANSLICIGKLCSTKDNALNLDGDGVSESSHRYAICPALLQAFRDSFPPVRSAALVVASACAPRWDAVEIARRVIPAISPLLVDGEKPVRSAALKAINTMVARAESHAQTMPDTQVKRAPAAQNPTSNQQEAASNTAAPDSWSGWAVSSLSSTLSGALSLTSSLPISQQQQQQQRATSVPADTSGRDNSSTTINSTATSQLAERAATSSSSPSISSSTTKKLASLTAPNTEDQDTSGWGFNDDGWDDDSWGNDGWDSNAPKKSPVLPTTPKKTSFKLSKTNAAKSAAASTTLSGEATSSRRKGLGAMKLGSSKNKPVDDIF
ncbi:Nuclear aminoacylation-dependent tRNA export pathway component [Dipsacomyces acuminosporus]|nr:Nuclear aminoacylation-dependent tRNA export pathway component [Dipsacomyces acuminosporus]